MAGCVSVLAGVVISLVPIGPCNHSVWQFACVIVLMPALAVASCFFDVNTWGFQRMMFIIGCIQGGVIVGLYYMAARIFKELSKIKNT